MRSLSRLAAIALVSTSLTPAFAADISEQGAKDIQATLTQYLPQDLVDGGLVKVTAGADRYELALDLEPLIKKIGSADLTISGLKPFLHFLMPQDDGLWKIEANQSLDLKIGLVNGGKKTAIGYQIEKMTADGLFDPAISYFKDLKWTATSVAVTTLSDSETSSFTIASMDQTTQSTKIDDSHITVVSRATLTDIKQSVSVKDAGVYGFSAASAAVDVNFENFGIDPFRDLVLFVLDRIKDDKLSPEDAARLKVILRANLPFGTKLEETVGFDDIKVQGDGMEFAFGEMDYKFDFDGFTQNTTIGFEMSTVDLSVPPGLLPPGTDSALPESVSFGAAVTGLNLAGAANYFLDHADLTSDEPLTPTESKEIGRIILPDGKLHIEFRNVKAKSANYDIEMTGSMVVYPDQTNRQSADVTIYARDLDKTIAYLQSNASIVPQFGQASFGAQMMKGFAKQAPDGRFMWNVVVGEDNQVTINGQPMPQ